jgi:predicted aconitase
MRLLVTLGEVYEAKRMIPVFSCHVGGRSYLISGEESIEWMTELYDGGARFQFSPPRTPVRWTSIGGSRWAYPKTLSASRAGQTRVT